MIKTILRRVRTSRRLLDEHVYDVFEPSRALVDLALAPRAVALLQGVAHESRDLFPVAVPIERRAREGEQVLDHLPRRDGAPGFDVDQLGVEPVARGDPVGGAQ